MSGLWNRLADRGETGDPLSAHMLRAVVYLVARNVFTPAQARTKLESRLHVALTAAEAQDLSNILTVFQGLGTAAAKLDYLERIHALAICVETGLLTSEATWRSELGIA